MIGSGTIAEAEAGASAASGRLDGSGIGARVIGTRRPSTMSLTGLALLIECPAERAQRAAYDAQQVIDQLVLLRQRPDGR